jgi:ribosomal-protein-alanine N-acetyltransferase
MVLSGKMRIRRAQQKDIEMITGIESLSFSDPWDQNAFYETLRFYPNTFFIAEIDGKIAGFIAAGIEDTGEVLVGHIMNLAVLPELRKRGIGRELVTRTEREFILEGVSSIQLEVRESNVNAQEFYERLGYQKILTIAEYYANGEDAIIMMKWFLL